MNILVVSQYFWPENFRVNELVAELVGRGHCVTVLTGQPNYPDGVVFPPYRQNPRDFDRYMGARVLRVPMLPRGQGALRLAFNYLSFALSGCLIGAWKLRGQPVDVIFTFAPSPVTVGIPSGWLRRIKRAPQVFWVLDLWPDTLKAVGVVNSPRLLGVVGWLVRQVYRHCDLVLGQSRSFIDNIRHYATERTAVEYFPGWAEAGLQQEDVTPAPELPRRPEVFTIVFAGNIGDAQDFPAILDAAERLRSRQDIRWAIVGDGRMAPWVREQIDARQLDLSVVMLGRHPLERMPAFFAHADALLVSLKDRPVFAMTIPGKLQAYLATGLPVLAMLNGEGARIVQDGNAGLVCAAGDAQGHGVSQCAEAVFRKSCFTGRCNLAGAQGVRTVSRRQRSGVGDG